MLTPFTILKVEHIVRVDLTLLSKKSSWDCWIKTYQNDFLVLLSSN